MFGPDLESEKTQIWIAVIGSVSAVMAAAAPGLVQWARDTGKNTKAKKDENPDKSKETPSRTTNSGFREIR